MPVQVLFAAKPDRWGVYGGLLTRALSEAGVVAEVGPELGPPEVIDYVVYAPNAQVQDFTPFARCKAVLSLWAGVETIVGNKTLTQPLTRMVDPGLTEGMVEWVTGHVLRHHLNIDHCLVHQAGDWVRHVPPLARHRRVTVLGLGELGAACAEMLAALNFRVTGWSRTPRDVPGVRCLHGSDGLQQALDQAEIVVTLLPDTPQTENVLNADTLALTARGACIVNPGRGPLIEDAALLAALEDGQIGHATLDVFRIEPLPKDHPYWGHPRVTVCPHIASETRPETAVGVIAENIRRSEAGEPLLYLVDRMRGY